MECNLIKALSSSFSVSSFHPSLLSWALFPWPGSPIYLYLSAFALTPNSKENQEEEGTIDRESVGGKYSTVVGCGRRRRFRTDRSADDGRRKVDYNYKEWGEKKPWELSRMGWEEVRSKRRLVLPNQRDF